MAHTLSRRSGPRRWLRAVEWLVAAGHHPRANATTLAVARDLAARMDYDSGQVRYQLGPMQGRLGRSRATVARHVATLRELGALAWVAHGSRSNARRARGLDGYAGTATVYAAVIPPAYDLARGHRVVGRGYEARIVVDLRERRETPSLTSGQEEGEKKVRGGVTTTAGRPRTDSPAPATEAAGKRRRRRTTVLGATVTAAGMALGDRLARAVRRRVPWTRPARHDELRWVCADMGEQRWSEEQAVRFAGEAGALRGAGVLWQPERPHRLLAAELRRWQEQRDEERRAQEAVAASVAWKDSTAARDLASLVKLFGAAPPVPVRRARTAEDRLRARMDWDVWPEVLDHLAADPDDAGDLYGEALCTYALGRGAR
ncbi:hypothetical protein [Streptomyces sp. NPDC006552]|uniref:hypothetical protein n=1 Tax=Streptomyces sp. NPDC006552 TaxID=3157179 RepID=UPI00339E2F37